MSNNDQKDPYLTDHVYDGIEEADNPLPKWWLYGFYLCIVFAVLYTGYYEFGPGISLGEAYNQAVAPIKAQRAEAAKSGIDPAMLAAAVADPAQVAKGKELFVAKTCANCHGEQGQGIIGPNLTDKFWIHGGKPEMVFTTIKTGVPDKGMPVWGEQLSQEEMTSLTAFVLSLKGTNPPNAKDPQGDPEDGAAAAPAPVTAAVP
jgi:cytochrome c oxidase cbb3-type subunit 3